MRKGGWERKTWKGKSLAVLIFGVLSDTTIIEFKKKCNEVGLYCFCNRKITQGGEPFRATIIPKASTE